MKINNLQKMAATFGMVLLILYSFRDTFIDDSFFTPFESVIITAIIFFFWIIILSDDK